MGDELESGLCPGFAVRRGFQYVLSLSSMGAGTHIVLASGVAVSEYYYPARTFLTHGNRQQPMKDLSLQDRVSS